MKLTDRTMEEASANGDGTFNGLTAMRWIYEALTGNPLSESEAEVIADEAKRKAEARRVR